jgi:hypothetical protein
MWTDDKEIDRVAFQLLSAQMMSWTGMALAIFILFVMLDLRTAIGLAALGWAIHWHLGTNAAIAHNRNLILAGLQARDINALGKAVENGGGNFLDHLKAADAEYDNALNSPLSHTTHRLGFWGALTMFGFDLLILVSVAALGIWAKSYVDALLALAPQ